MKTKDIIDSLKDQAKDKRALANGDSESIFIADAEALEKAQEILQAVVQMEEKIRQSDSKCSDYTVNEYCAECGSDVEMTWDVATDGYEAFCPHCGKKLMLCDACLHSDDNAAQRCDFSEGLDGKGCCFRRKSTASLRCMMITTISDARIK